MATIKINRNVELTNKFRSFKIVIDGNVVGKINEGETKSFEVTDGFHKIYAKIDWCRSPIVDLNFSQNETKEITIAGYKHSKWLVPLSLIILAVYYLITLQFLNSIPVALFIVSLIVIPQIYYITFGKNKYLQIKLKEDE